MTKAIRFSKLGGPEVLEIYDGPVGEPGPGEAKLRVQAVGLNRAELMYMAGHYLEQPQLPSRIGYEASGIVEAVGEGVDASWLGKQVSTMPGFSMNKYGVLGETALVPADSLAEYPAKLTPEEGASIWMQYGTAYGALVMHAKIAAGDFVLITAASSSVGLAAIEIAKAEGAIPIAATRTSAKRTALMGLGAAEVIATEEEDLGARVREITDGKLCRVIFDPIAGSIVEKLAEAAAPGGTIFEYGVLSMEPTPFPLRAALGKGLSIRGYSLSELRRNPDELAKARAYILEHLNDSRFTPKISKIFPLVKAADAYEYMASNAQIGKVVVAVHSLP